MHRIRIWLKAAGMAAGILAWGCAAAQTTTGITKDSIKIGLIGPMTGPAALFGKAVFGAEAVYRRINDQGGINGRKIVLVREDTGCNPARGMAAVKKLIYQDQVFAIDGGLCSNVVVAVKPEVEKARIPFMGLGAATPKLAEPFVPTIYQPVATTDIVGRALVDFAMSKPGTKKIAFVSHSDDWGKSNLEPALDQLKRKYGLDPVANLTMERGSTDATPQILRLRKSGADFVIVMMYPAEVAIFMRDAYKYGLKLPTLAPQSISLDDTRDRAGGPATVRNFFVFYPYAHPVDSPEMQKWAALIKKYYPSERIESFSFLGMSGALAMVKAMQDAGPDLSREKLVQALDKLHDFDTGISSAPLTFTPHDHAGIKGGAMATYKDGKVVVVKTWQGK